MMKRSSFILTAAMLAALGFGTGQALAQMQATHTVAPRSLAAAATLKNTAQQANKLTVKVAAAASTQAAQPTLAQILADPKTNFHPITLANGIELGPNVPARIIIGQLNPTPVQERIAAGSLFLTILLISVVWAAAANREHNESIQN